MALKKINRGASEWPEGEGYWVFFVARDYVPGHAFVVWAIRNRKTRKWKEFQAYGLYPDENMVKVAFGTVPGKVVLETIKSINSANIGLAVGVTPEMYRYALTSVKAISEYPEDYNLYNQNCIDFTRLVAKSLSLNIPPDSINHPQIFIRQMMGLNKKKAQ